MADTNDKAYEIMAAIKEKLDFENHMLDKTVKKLEEVDVVLNDFHAKDNLTYNEYQELAEEHSRLYKLMRGYVNSSYALETAYNVCLEILGEEE